ncbi:neprilysin-11-like [Paramacrobiotus metropolitanus]|uniref:neprilysin-11-like n=1 Tax=Paramacrobiotus metropolitanus TaxID=2943436 RepID=UPI0024461C73|nr:neprilysin-11-like [Paramacrobiotus metropolitanus]
MFYFSANKGRARRTWISIYLLALITGILGCPTVKQAICESESCKKAATNILTSMDTNLDPCDDFYDYACNNWIKSHPLSDNRTENSIFEDLGEQMVLKRKELLELNSTDPFASEIKAKQFYKQCKDKKNIEAIRSKPILDYLKSTMDGWPILDPAWDPAGFDLFHVLKAIRAHGNEPLFSVYVAADLEHPEENVLFLGEANTHASRDILVSETGDSYSESYKTYIRAVVSSLMNDTGDTRLVDDVEKDIDDIMEFSKYLSMSGLTAVEKRNLTILKIKTSFTTVQRDVFYRSRFAQQLFDYVQDLYDVLQLGDRITPTMDIVLRSPGWYDKLDEKLMELENGIAGKRYLANYIGWRIITESIDYLNKDLRDALSQHNSRIKGTKQPRDKPSSERCANEISNVMPNVLGALYVRDMVQPLLKQKASTLMADLKEGFRELLVAATWMDIDTYALGISKLTAMQELAGFPDEFKNNISAVDEDYEMVRIGHTYFDTVLMISKSEAYKHLKKLFKRNVRFDPLADAYDITNINAYNALGKNSIVVLAATLQAPIFDAESPQYLNYGAAGFFVGHEITHGFDDQGSSFDDQGMMRPWWSGQTMETYNKRKQSIVDQYNSYSLPGGKINGELTLGENIADNGGLKAAFRGYKRYRQRSPVPEPSLPGLEHMPIDQLFFLSAAQVWCSNKRPESEHLHLLTDPHSPFKFRINGPMSNMPEFAKAFKCRLGSKMNPVQKNVVW